MSGQHTQDFVQLREFAREGPHQPLDLTEFAEPAGKRFRCLLVHPIGRHHAVQQVAPAKDIPKIKGLRKTWKYEITDKEAFIKAAWKGEGSLSRDCIIDDKLILGPLVRALKANFRADGVRQGDDIDGGHGFASFRQISVVE